jgi:serine phosphatase RsbU (regulator of sigma subunit)/pSer/pThr/pTyr-binding forkhead associated (FHA) protein
MAILKVIRGPEQGKLLSLGDKAMTLGRSLNCDIVIPATSVSREHARILCIDGCHHIEDLGSRNGVFVNNQQVHERTLLRDSDQIRICDWIAVYATQPTPEGVYGSPEELFGVLLAGTEGGDDQLAVLLALVAPVEDECRRIHAALAVNHVFYDRAEVGGLQDQLARVESPARRILAEGFHCLVVLDAAQGLDAAGRQFDLHRFLRHAHEEMIRAFGLPLPPDRFHVENISQILKDEPRSLFCFLNLQCVPAADLHRLRGFTQERHQVLFVCCGPRDLADEEVDDLSPGSSFVETTVQRVRPAAESSSLLGVCTALHRTLDTDVLPAQIADALLQVFPQAERSLVIIEDESSRLRVPAARSRRTGTADLPFSQTIVRRCLESGQGFLSEDASLRDPRLSDESLASLSVRSLICVPLVAAEGETFGVLQVDTTDRTRRFREEDLAVLWSVANQAAVALENARAHERRSQEQRVAREMAIAGQVQQSFLPQQLPAIAGYEFFAHHGPALEVSSDYYDFVSLPGGRLAVLLGDVAGRGVPAALLMARASSDTRLCLLTEPDPARALAQLNNMVGRHTRTMDRFVTLMVAVLDPSTHTVTLLNAGHLAPLVYRRACVQLEQAMAGDDIGMPLGIMEDMVYPVRQLQLEPGDSLLALTDGVTEATNHAGRLFGLQGIHAALQGEGFGPQQLGARIVQAVAQHARGCESRDDITVVCFGRVGNTS